ncbi:hypothetical protein JQ597_17670 [Bradyrhizobium sp. AUGA SZCCT0177]|nr:hypothetical protein [Bradyrhizobium sp. AUGA SZCCT0177]
MRAAAEAAASVAVQAVFMAVEAVFMAALEGFMAEAIAMREVFDPHIR